MSEQTAAPSSDERPWYRWYVLGVLLLAYVFNFIDRSILGILNEAIKADLGTTDTQMGFLGGAAFAVFYTFVGIPIARLADRGNRRNILAVCVGLWSFMTGVCGLAANYVQLVLARIGVAVGEAGGSPPSHSMISDMFPSHERATALAVYALGIPIGGMIGALAGGWINAAFDWRTAFMVVGFPGLLLAVFIRFGIREPLRGASDGPPKVDQPSVAAPPVGEVLRYLWSRRSFRYLALAAGVNGFVGYGVGYWALAFWQRSHGMDTQTLGTWTFWLGFPAMASTFFGGWFGDRLAQRDVRWYVWLPAIAAVVALPINLFVYLWDDYVVALLVSILPGLLGSFWLAPTFSLTQGLVALRMRALAASIVLFVLNLIGLGLGPQLTGVLSDVLRATTDLGDESLRWAIVAVSFVALIATLFYVLAARTLRADLARAGEP